MVIIVVSTGCLFSIIFHLGTKEPPAKMQNKKGLLKTTTVRGWQRGDRDPVSRTNFNKIHASRFE